MLGDASFIGGFDLTAVVVIAAVVVVFLLQHRAGTVRYGKLEAKVGGVAEKVEEVKEFAASTDHAVNGRAPEKPTISDDAVHIRESVETLRGIVEAGLNRVEVTQTMLSDRLSEVGRNSKEALDLARSSDRKADAAASLAADVAAALIETTKDHEED